MSDKEKFDPPPLAERRSRPRKKVLFAGVIVYDEGTYVLNCGIRDLSEASVRISLPAGQNLPQDFYFINMKNQTAHKARMVWRKTDEAGLALDSTHDLRNLSDPGLAYLAQIWASRNTVNATWR